MLILAFDTTSDKGGVGIFRGAACLALVPNDGATNRFSIALFEMVERALAEAHLEQRDIELYAVANGPGSFTGIRIGIAAALAWGKVFERPVRGVSTLAALASHAAGDFDWVFPLLDAHRSEFYLGCFRRTASVGPAPADFEAVDEGWVLNPAMVRALVEQRLASGG